MKLDQRESSKLYLRNAVISKYDYRLPSIAYQQHIKPDMKSSKPYLRAMPEDPSTWFIAAFRSFNRIPEKRKQYKTSQNTSNRGTFAVMFVIWNTLSFRSSTYTAHKETIQIALHVMLLYEHAFISFTLQSYTGAKRPALRKSSKLYFI